MIIYFNCDYLMSSIDLFANYRDNSFNDDFNDEENEELTFNLSDNWSNYEYDNDDCDYFVNVTKKLRLDPDYPDTD